jgi:hypothetical protein
MIPLSVVLIVNDGNKLIIKLLIYYLFCELKENISESFYRLHQYIYICVYFLFLILFNSALLSTITFLSSGVLYILLR